MRHASTGHGRRRLSAASAVALLSAGLGLTSWSLTSDPELAPPVAASSTTASGPVLEIRRDAPEQSRDGTPHQPGNASERERAPRLEQPAPAVLPRSAPARVRVDRLGVDSSIIELGLLADGSLEVPESPDIAGWYTGSPTPGELGPSVLAGHVDSTRGPGVFFRLRELVPGDRITVERADGSAPVFVVERVEQHPKDQFPTARVYGNVDHAALRLITCGGTFDRSTGHYRSNVVVYARLDPASARV